MAYLYISEHVGVGLSQNANFESGPQAPVEPSLRVQKVEHTGASVQSLELLPETRLVVIHPTAISSYKVAADPEATVDDMRLPADIHWPICIATPGMKIAVILNT